MKMMQNVNFHPGFLNVETFSLSDKVYSFDFSMENSFMNYKPTSWITFLAVDWLTFEVCDSNDYAGIFCPCGLTEICFLTHGLTHLLLINKN